MTISPPTIVITSAGPTGLSRWRELWTARDLWWFLVWRDLKTRYIQSVLGLGWAVIQPLFTMGIFTIIFGKLAGVPSDGVPYAAFSLTAVVAWTFFQTVVTDASNSLTNNMGLVTKVYFPRLILPLASVTARLMDLAIMLLMLALMLALTGIRPSFNAVFAVPAALGVTLVSGAGLGLWLAGLGVQYRDVRYSQALGLQLLMYASPVIYSAKQVPAKWQTLYSLNPLTGVIESMRASLLGTGPVPWSTLGLDTFIALVLYTTGTWCFHRAVRIYADVA